MSMILDAVSRSAAYQNGLMLRASMSMAWAFMALRRVWTSSMRSQGCGLTPMTALASRTPTCACMSMTRARVPLTVVRRRATGPGAALVIVSSVSTAHILEPRRAEPANVSVNGIHREDGLVVRAARPYTAVRYELRMMRG